MWGPLEQAPTCRIKPQEKISVCHGGAWGSHPAEAGGRCCHCSPVQQVAAVTSGSRSPTWVTFSAGELIDGLSPCLSARGRAESVPGSDHCTKTSTETTAKGGPAKVDSVACQAGTHRLQGFGKRPAWRCAGLPSLPAAKRTHLGASSEPACTCRRSPSYRCSPTGAEVQAQRKEPGSHSKQTQGLKPTLT